MRAIRLLITCIGGSTVPSLIKCLKNSGNFNYILVGVDSVSAGKSIDILDSYYQVPNGSDAEYHDKLLEIALKERVDFILPGSDEEALSISKKIDKFNDDRNTFNTNFNNAKMKYSQKILDILNPILSPVVSIFELQTELLLQEYSYDVREYLTFRHHH